jgi:hypothetical protein
MFERSIKTNNAVVDMLTLGGDVATGVHLLSSTIANIKQCMTAVQAGALIPTSANAPSNGTFVAISLKAFEIPKANQSIDENRIGKNDRFVYSKLLKIAFSPEGNPVSTADFDAFSMTCSAAIIFNLAVCAHVGGLSYLEGNNNTTDRNMLNKSEQLYRLILDLLQSYVEKGERESPTTSSAVVGQVERDFLSLYVIARNNLACIDAALSGMKSNELRASFSQILQAMNTTETITPDFLDHNPLMTERDWHEISSNCIGVLFGQQRDLASAPAA